MTFKWNKSKESWVTFLDELAGAIAKEGDVTHESVVKSLKTREQIRQTHQRISWVFDSQQQGAIMFIEVKDANGNIVERAAKEDKLA